MELTKEYFDQQINSIRKDMVTKEYLDGRLANFATKDDLKNFVTKQDLEVLRQEIKIDMTREISDAIADLAYTINETIAIPLTKHIQECERQWTAIR